MARVRALSQEEIERLREELAAGQQPMVWFTAKAVGVEEGRSGKVTALGDPKEGDFIQVKPTGSKDVLSFSPAEITLTKPERKAERRSKAAESAPSAPARPVPQATTPSAPPPSRPVPAPSASTAPTSPERGRPAVEEPAKRSGRPSTGRRKGEPTLTVTLASTPEGEWSVEVLAGKKRTVRDLPVSPGAVAQVAKALPPEVAEAIEGVLETARELQRARVAQLQAELEQARRMLDELSG